MFGSQFYPTPANLINQMLANIEIKLNRNSEILEPSAGKGDLADGIVSKMNNKYRNFINNVDTIELDQNLTYILQGKGYRVIYDDFLTFNTLKKYDLIVMNPPFEDGYKHLLKAIDLQKDGGDIVALLNAETLKNPYSNGRKELIKQLTRMDVNHEIHYLSDSFKDAERTTNVEVALIKISIQKKAKPSYFRSKMEKAQLEKDNDNVATYQISENNIIRSFVKQYELEAGSGVEFIKEYNAMKSNMLLSFDEIGKNRSLLELTVPYSTGHDEITINSFLYSVRHKYWKALFKNEKFTSTLTNSLLADLRERIDEFANYDFNLYNIFNLQHELSKNFMLGIEETALKLFDELSHQYSYSSYSNNVHYYNGWRTNKSWFVNKKVILPLDSSWMPSYASDFYGFKVREKLEDIEKTLNYFNGNKPLDKSVSSVLEAAEQENRMKNLEFKYFSVSFYIKGTVHITFTDLDLLKRLNIFAGQRKAWLPPTYGNKKYDDMSNEDKEIIDSFEGVESYNNMLQNKSEFILESKELLIQI